MEAASWKRNPGRGIMRKASWKSSHAKASWKSIHALDMQHRQAVFPIVRTHARAFSKNERHRSALRQSLINARTLAGEANPSAR